MSGLLCHLRGRRPRALPRWLALVPALALVTFVVAGALHSHAREDLAHPCALCSLSHAPATLSPAVSELPRPCAAERVAPRIVEAPRSLAPLCPLGRAPPEA